MRGFTLESTVNETADWYTPPAIFAALGEQFDLDPCSPGVGVTAVPASRHLTLVDDGLTADWGDAFAFVNPPYGWETRVWMRKLADHGNGIALVFARTDVTWFQEVAERTSAVCFISGRVRFIDHRTGLPGGTPGAGSMLLAFGPRANRAVRDCGLGVIATFGTSPNVALVA